MNSQRFLCLALVPLLASVTEAARIHVTPDGMASGSGGTWQSAVTLDTALSVAAPGDVLWLQSGTHVPGASSFLLTTPLTMLGGFAGTETSADQRVPNQPPTVLSGEVGGPGLEDNRGPVVTATAAGTVVLENLTITRGLAAGDGGGLVFTGSGSLELRGVSVAGNRATGNGGGMSATGGSLMIVGGQFDSNRADSQGGAIAVNGTNLVVRDSTLAANTAGGGAGAIQSIAGGICSIQIEDSVVSDNTAGGIAPGLSFGAGTTTTVSSTVFRNLTGTSSAAILALDASVTINDATFENCGASSNRSGIVLCTAGGMVAMTDSRIIGGLLPNNGAAVQLRGGADASLLRVAINGQGGNLAGVRIESGGQLDMTEVWISATRQGIIAEQAAVTVSSGWFTDNGSSTAQAGGAQITGGSVVLNACTFSGNQGQLGGAVLASQTFIQCDGSLFINNQSGLSGGAIAATGGSMILTDTIFRSNAANAGFGGAVSATSPTSCEFRGCSIIENRSNSSGGGIHLSGGGLTLENSLLQGNVARGNGGALFYTAGSVSPPPVLQVNFTTAIQNQAGAGSPSGLGGGLYIDGAATLTLSNSLFGDNSHQPPSENFPPVPPPRAANDVSCPDSTVDCSNCNILDLAGTNLTRHPLADCVVDADGPDNDPLTIADNNPFPTALVDDLGQNRIEDLRGPLSLNNGSSSRGAIERSGGPTNQPPTVDAVDIILHPDGMSAFFVVLTIDDPDAGSGELEVEIQSETGLIHWNGCDFGKIPGGSSIKFRGSLAQLNAILPRISFTFPTPVDRAIINLRIDDHGHTGDGGPQRAAELLIAESGGSVGIEILASILTAGGDIFEMTVRSAVPLTAGNLRVERSDDCVKWLEDTDESVIPAGDNLYKVEVPIPVPHPTQTFFRLGME